MGEIKANRGDKARIWEPELISELNEMCRVPYQLTCRFNTDPRLVLQLGAYL